MDNEKTQLQTIDEYIAACPPEVGALLQKLRETVHDAVPEVTEKISWQMPTFCKNGIVIQFAAFQKHIGVYPGPDAIVAFKEQISQFKSTKGGFQLPVNKDLPLELFRKVVLYRLDANNIKAAEKSKKKSGSAK